MLKVVDGPDKDSKMAQRVEVQVGMRQPGKVEILRGLQPGDTVVTAGHQRVQGDGVAVRVVDLSRAAIGRCSGAAAGSSCRARRSCGARSASAACGLTPARGGRQPLRHARGVLTRRPSGEPLYAAR